VHDRGEHQEKNVTGGVVSIPQSHEIEYIHVSQSRLTRYGHYGYMQPPEKVKPYTTVITISS
jgi:hypothetical protein